MACTNAKLYLALIDLARSRPAHYRAGIEARARRVYRQLDARERRIVERVF
jgi:hypothetical protein